MNDNDIIKALECCRTGDCIHCPRWKTEYIAGDCTDIFPMVLDLINRQKAEIEALKLINSTYEVETKRVRDIAIKEFAQRLKDVDLYLYVEEHYKNAELCCEVRQDRFCKDIDNLMKEMTEEQK